MRLEEILEQAHFVPWRPHEKRQSVLRKSDRLCQMLAGKDKDTGRTTEVDNVKAVSMECWRQSHSEENGREERDKKRQASRGVSPQR